AASIPWDNCDFVPTTAVRVGEAPVCAIAATCVALEDLLGNLPRMNDHRGQGELVAANITTGPQGQFDGEQWGQFFSVFDQEAFRCAVARIVDEGGNIDTCLEVEVRR
ncbi:unnamed protein product, partial [Sphacelaria rigidula]